MPVERDHTILSRAGLLALRACLYACGGLAAAVILALIFGLLGLAGAASPSTDGSSGTGVLGWLVVIGYLYTAGVLIVAWKQK